MKKVILLAACACLGFSAASWSQTLVPMTPGQYMRGQVAQSIGQLALAIGALAAKNRELEEEIVNARREFFERANTPDGPAAAKKFEEALHKRDLHYVVYDVMSDRRAGPLLKLSAQIAGSHRLDGGLSPFSYSTFTAWSNRLVANVSEFGELQAALKHAMPQFETYRKERDLAEALFFNPKSALRTENPHAQEYLAAWLLGTKAEKTLSAANTSAARIATQLGKDRLATIVAVLRDWTVVSDHLEGPWESGPTAVLDPLVSGKPNPAWPADWTPQLRTFLEVRGRLNDPRVKLAGSLDEVQQLWDAGRKQKDWATLRSAAARRDRLLQEIDIVSSRSLDMAPNEFQLTRSMTELNFAFIDRGIQALEIDAMGRGEKNPRGEEVAQRSREYLAVNAKLIPRTVQTPPEPTDFSARQPATGNPGASERGPGSADGTGSRRATRRGTPGEAPAARQQPTPAPAPVQPAPTPIGPPLPDPNEEGIGPFDRAIILAQRPGAIHITPTHLSAVLSILAKQWDGVYNNDESDAETRKIYLNRSVEETRRLVKDLRAAIVENERVFNLIPNRRNDPQQLAWHEQHNGALQAVVDELEARMPDLEAAIAKPRPKSAR